MMNRVPLVGACWFIFWTGVGFIAGRLLGVPVSYTVGGFGLGLISMFAWPFIFPNRLQNWMEDCDD